MNDIRSYADCLAAILGIRTPGLIALSSQEMKKIANSNTKAAYDRARKVIYYLPKKKYSIMDIYILSHEMRHAWQDIVDPDKYFGEYYEDFTEQEYHEFFAEIDANAFACIAIAILYDKITRRNYTKNKNAQAKYDARLEELKLEYGIEF